MEWSSLSDQTAKFKPPYDEKDKLAINLLGEIGQRTLGTLVDLVGVSKAIEILSPAARFYGASVNNWIIRELGIEGSDLEKTCSLMQEVNQLMGKELRPYELTSSGASCEVLACQFSNAKPEFCELVCAIAGNGMCHNINPRYNFVIPSRMSLGAESCRWVIIDSSAKSDPQSEDVLSIISWKQFDKLILDQSDLEVSKEQYWIAALGAWWIQEVTTLIATYGGGRTVEILSPSLRALGFSFGLQIHEELKLERNDAVAIGSVLDVLNESLRQNGEVRQADPHLAVKEMTECPVFAGAPPEMCLLFETLANGICEAINPDFEVVHEKAICRGDSSCIRLIKKREEPTKMKSKEEGPSDDPIKRLTNKFIDGEITEEEFRKKLAVLKELKL